MKYRKKQIEVAAFVIGHDLIPDWCCSEKVIGNNDNYTWYIHLGGIDTFTTARTGQWVVKDGYNLKVMDNDIFIATYEAVE